MDEATVSPHSRLATLLLCLFLGWAGAHRFFTGKKGTAVLMLCTVGGLGFWVLADFILIVCGAFRDRQGRRVFKWFEAGSV